MITLHFPEGQHVSFCNLGIVVSKNHSGQNSPWGRGVYSHPKVYTYKLVLWIGLVLLRLNISVNIFSVMSGRKVLWRNDKMFNYHQIQTSLDLGLCYIGKLQELHERISVLNKYCMFNEIQYFNKYGAVK